jgi:hypothetical protein
VGRIQPRYRKPPSSVPTVPAPSPAARFTADVRSAAQSTGGKAGSRAARGDSRTSVRFLTCASRGGSCRFAGVGAGTPPSTPSRKRGHHENLGHLCHAAWQHNQEREATAIEKYVDSVVPSTGLKPASVAVFGGRMVFFGKEVVNNWDGERVRAWAATLPELLR